nr:MULTISPECIES: hypothetical protein [unclassified Thioalkalivibrio]
MAAAVSTAPAVASDTYRPLVLAYTESGHDVSEEAANVRERLEEANFQFLGEYPINDQRHVVVVTHNDLLAAAGSHDRAGYIAPIRVSVTSVNGEIQVSYNNLDYFGHAYRIEEPLDSVSSLLADTLGAEKEFGSEEGLTERELSRYRYSFGMERFHQPFELGSHGSYSEALTEVTSNLEAGLEGVTKVYRVEIPGQDTTIFGVAIREADGANEDAADLHHLDTVDVRGLRHTATVPIEVMVRGSDVEALSMRYRKALHFPDLNMLGDGSFMRLRRSPDAVEASLRVIAGYEEEEQFGFDDW